MNILEYQEFCKRLDDSSLGNRFKLVGDKGSVEVEWLDLDMGLVKIDYFGEEKFFRGIDFCEPYMTGITVEPMNENLKTVIQSLENSISIQTTEEEEGENNILN